MRCLLDTCVFLWVLTANQQRLSNFMPILDDNSNSFYVSAVTYWEIILKQSAGKLIINDDIVQSASDSNIDWISINVNHLQRLSDLPKIHNDPFDRLLIAQSLVENMTLLTSDQNINLYFNKIHKQ